MSCTCKNSVKSSVGMTKFVPSINSSDPSSLVTWTPLAPLQNTKSDLACTEESVPLFPEDITL